MVEREIDVDGIRILARYAGLDLAEDRVDFQLELVRQQLETVASWKQFDLPFAFRDGEFSFVRPAVIYRPPWEVPTPLNGGTRGSR